MKARKSSLNFSSKNSRKFFLFPMIIGGVPILGSIYAILSLARVCNSGHKQFRMDCIRARLPRHSLEEFKGTSYKLAPVKYPDTVLKKLKVRVPNSSQ